MPEKSTAKPPENIQEEREFFFAGGLEYQPITIKAKTQEEALEIWEKVRVKVEN